MSGWWIAQVRSKLTAGEIMKVTVIGSGYVGLTTGVCLTAFGNEVVLVDTDQKRLDTVISGHPPFYEPGLADLIKKGIKSGALSVGTNYEQCLVGSDVSIIAVGTPQDEKGNTNLSYIEQASRSLGACLPQLGYHVVTIKSTVAPGTTANLVKNTLEKASGMKVGEFGLCMTPEFLREGTAVKDFMHPDRIVIGQYDQRSGDVLAALNSAFDCPILRVEITNAELIKYASNSLLATMISFANEIASICEKTPNTDVDTVLDGMLLDRRMTPLNDGKPITPGIHAYLRAGIGFGGSCLPKDVNALREYASSISEKMNLLDAVVEVNKQRPAKFVDMVEKELGDLNKKVITLFGLAFKEGTDDLRDSPSLNVLKELARRGTDVRVYDPLVSPEICKTLGVRLVTDIRESLTKADAVVITMSDPQFRELDWGDLGSEMRRGLVFDGRNILRGLDIPDGIDYKPIGRKA